MAQQKLKTGGGVLAVAAAQILIGIILLGLYEAYKVKFLNDDMDAQMVHLKKMAEFHRKQAEAHSKSTGEDVHFPTNEELKLSVHPRMITPMDFLFYLAIINNVCCLLGMAGVFNTQRALVIGYFVYNAAAVVVSFHYFVDACADVGVHFEGGRGGTVGYERAAAVFLFFSFALSLCASALALRAVDEIRTKNREEYQKMAMMTENLQFESDGRTGV